MSNNEFKWWQAYSMVRPLQATRLDIMEANIIGAFTGSRPSNCLSDWFDPMKDPELKAEKDAETVKELQELEAKNKSKCQAKSKK